MKIASSFVYAKFTVLQRKLHSSGKKIYTYLACTSFDSMSRKPNIIEISIYLLQQLRKD